jgi:predicted P-loop ATPase
MKKASVNFQLLAEHLQKYNANLIPTIVSGGKSEGYEYTAASVFGGQGNSFKFNTLTGKWADFANESHRGNDIISLYALVHNMSNLDAAKILADLTSYNFSAEQSLSDKLPNLISGKYGQPSGYWVYKNKRGLNVALVVRYDPADEKKQFSQWHFSQLDNKWNPKAHPDPRPLFKLDQIERYPNKTIILCEGEKAAEAAQELYGDDFIATCWLGGAQAHTKTDFSPMYGKNVIIWPDADEVGIKTMASIAAKLVIHAISLTSIQPLPTDPKGFDAYDLLQQAPDFFAFDEYLDKRISIIKAASVAKSDPALPESDNHTVTGVALPYSEDEQELDIYREANMVQKWQDTNLAMKSQTKPFLNEQNVLRILKRDTKLNLSVYFDEFFKTYMSTFGSTRPESFSDITFTKFKLFLQEEFGLGDISTATIKESLRYHASQTTKNEVADYLRSLKWDGQPRIDSFMHVIYGADNTEYNTAASRIFWLSMVARILEPATKADIMIILEGDQGIQKSASLEEIGSLNGRCFYATAGKKLDNKDFYIGLTGKFIIEMGEINVLLKNSDEEIKEMLSTRIDNFRIPYASEATPNARTNIFVGTTNQENYLRDETGSRRFLPVRCKSVNMDLLKDVKLQLFAEAVYRKQQGENHWVFPKELAKEETDQRMEIDDIWTDDVLKYCYDNKYQYVKITDVARDCLHISIDKQDQRALNRISKILKKAGFTKYQMREDGRKSWVFQDMAQVSSKKTWVDRPFLMT